MNFFGVRHAERAVVVAMTAGLLLSTPSAHAANRADVSHIAASVHAAHAAATVGASCASMLPFYCEVIRRGLAKVYVNPRQGAGPTQGLRHFVRGAHLSVSCRFRNRRGVFYQVYGWWRYKGVTQRTAWVFADMFWHPNDPAVPLCGGSLELQGLPTLK